MSIDSTTQLYASVRDAQERYGERELRHITDPDAQALDHGRLEQALEDATAEINSYLSARYLIPLLRNCKIDGVYPLLTPPVALKRYCIDIAIYRLQTLRPKDDVEDARKRYEDVIKALTLIRIGEVELGGARLRDDAASAQHTSSGGAYFTQQPHHFARDQRDARHGAPWNTAPSTLEQLPEGYPIIPPYVGVSKQTKLQAEQNGGDSGEVCPL